MPESRTDDCCRTPGTGSGTPDPRIAHHFDERVNDATVGGTFPEMVEVSRGLLYMLCDAADTQPTLLEFGCGSGAMSVTLLESGAAHADGIDLSPVSIATAQRRAEAAGVSDRASFTVGDGSVAPVEPHDWVVLDRVICCFGDVDRLLDHSISVAEKRYAFTVPLDSGWQGLANRIVRMTDRFLLRFGGKGCPAYTHPIEKIRRRLRDAGFEVRNERKIGLWYAAVWQKGEMA